FYAGASAEIQNMMRKVTQHAQIASKKPVVGASFVAAYLGLEVDLNDRQTVEVDGSPKYDGAIIRGNGKVYPSVLLPLNSIDDSGMSDAVARGLQPQIGASAPTVESVHFRLKLLAARMSYICLWFNRALSGAAVELLKTKFPELIILVSTSEEESLINGLVFEQLHDLRQFIEGRY
ncbi:MAG: hypothetical protein WCK86_23535, partial [Planctomycetia bacterium]